MRAINILEQLLAEGEQNDNMVLGILRKGGVGDHITVDDLPDGTEDTAKALRDAQNQYRRGILERIKATPISNAENAPVLGRYQNGKNMLPVAKWWVNMKGDRDPLHGISDAVREVYGLNTTRQTAEQRGLDYYYNQFSDIRAFLQWLNKEAQRPENEVKPVQKELREYDFPDLEVYSDANVDVYKADTPKEAIRLGKEYSFCISSNGGGNQFYTYRFGTHPAWGAKQKTSCYFCWFKNEKGEKTWKDMIVVHVGENGKYLVTPARNGLFPWRSESYVLEHYPQLRPALPYMVYKKPTDQEELSARFSSGDILTYMPVRANKSRAKIPYNNVARYTPEQLEIVISLDVNLDDKAFDYIFETIDGKDLVKGNHGNSLIKKYIEIGNSELTEHQKQVLTDAGYGKEVERALLVSARNKLNYNLQRDAIYKYLSGEELKAAIINATDEELESKANSSALVRYLEPGAFYLDKGLKDLLIKRGRPDLAYQKERNNTRLARYISYKTKYEKYRNDLIPLTASDLQYIFDNPYNFDIDSVIKLYLKTWLDKDVHQDDIEIRQDRADVLRQHGYGKQVEELNNKLKKTSVSRWLGGFTAENDGWVVTKEKDGYVFTTANNGVNYLYAPYTTKPIKRIQLNGMVHFNGNFHLGIKNVLGKGLPPIVNKEGNLIKFGRLGVSLENLESLENYKITYDNLVLPSVFHLNAPKLKSLKGLPTPHHEIGLSLDCENSSLEGLESGNYALRIQDIGSMKGMPKKLTRLTIAEKAYKNAKDRQMPDEVTNTLVVEGRRGTIDILPKKVGFLEIDRRMILDARECAIGALPSIDDMKDNMSWYRARANESVLKATAKREVHHDNEDQDDDDFCQYGAMFYGKGAESEIPDREVVYTSSMAYRVSRYGIPIYVHPFVTSLEGLKVPVELVEGEKGTDPNDASYDYFDPCQLIVFNSRMTSLKGLPEEGFKSVFLYNCPLMEDISIVKHIAANSGGFIVYVGAGCKKLTNEVLEKINSGNVEVVKAKAYFDYKKYPHVDKTQNYFESLLRLSMILNGLYD